MEFPTTLLLYGSRIHQGKSKLPRHYFLPHAVWRFSMTLNQRLAAANTLRENDGQGVEMKVQDARTERANCVHPKTAIADVAAKMLETGSTLLPIALNNELMGVITRHDVVRRANDVDVARTPISKIMTHPVIYCDLEDDVDDAGAIMAKKGIRRLVVTDRGRPLGIVRAGHLARYIRDHRVSAR